MNKEDYIGQLTKNKRRQLRDEFDQQKTEYFNNLIKEKDKEIERLSKEVDMWNRKYNKQFNIITELEKVLNTEVMLRYHCKDNAKENKIFNAGGMLYRDYIIDTLKELKEGNDNDK